MSARPLALDLFCGAAGGWSLGLHRAGYRTVAAAEADPWRRSAFLANFPGVEMFDDVRAVTARSLRERLGYLPGVVVGSPPCQDASTANRNGKGVDGERTGLFFEAVRIVGEVRPAVGCLENVPGLRARGADRVLDGLEAAGYACWPLVVGAVHAGAPHRRNRVWFLFVRDDVAALADADGVRLQMRAGTADAPFAGGDGPLFGLPLGSLRAASATDADERRRGPRQAWGAGPGRLVLGAGTGGEAAADAPLGLWRPRNGEGYPEWTQDGGQPSHRGSPAADSDEAGLEILGGEPGDDGQEREAAERDGASLWDRWNGGYTAHAGRVDAWLSTQPPEPRGVTRACLAAYGDSVVPQITQAIGMTMRRLLDGQAA